MKVDSLLGHYRILKLLGAGGMGKVFLAEDTLLERRVALKVLPEDLAGDTDRMRRFVREAKATSALNHPNILTIYEIGESENTNYIAAEYVEGETLRERLRGEPLDLKSALDIAVQITSALQAAHGAGVVHRDVKPDNVMIRPDGLAKLLDFGIAKLTEKKTEPIDAEAATAIKDGTSAGMIIGTAAYMSPEQARGKAVDARSDIFSFGLVLYEMLSGRAAFEGESAMDVIGLILHKEPVLLGQQMPDVPHEIERIVGKALRKDCEERYQTAKDLLIDLKDAWQELEFQNKLGRTNPPHQEESKTQIINAATTDTPQSASSMEYVVGEIKSHKLGFVALSVLILATVGFGYWYFFSQTPDVKQIEKQIESIAVMPFVNESGSADVEYLSDGMTETLISSLSQLPKLNVKARSSVFRYKGRETDAQTIGRELNVQAILSGRIVQRGDNLTLYLSLVDAQTGNQIWGEPYNRKMIDLVSLQSEIARDVSSKLKIKLSGADEQRLAKNYTANPQAYQLYLRGNFHVEKRTEKEIWKGIEYLEQAVAADPNYALAYAGLASAHVALPNYSKVQWSAVMPKVKDATLKALSLDNNLAEAHVMLGIIMSIDGDDARAEREYQHAIELNPNSAMAYHFYSNLLRMQGKLEEAVDKQRRAVELEPLSLIINREYGSKLFFSRRYDEAIVQFKKTIELDAGFPSAHYGLALVYWMKGNYPEAVEEHATHQELNGEPNKAALLRENFAKDGWQGFLRTITDESLKFDLSWDDLTPYYAALGNKDKAFELLNKRVESRKVRPGMLIDPRLDPLRDDPRFQELLRRVGFPP